MRKVPIFALQPRPAIALNAHQAGGIVARMGNGSPNTPDNVLTQAQMRSQTAAVPQVSCHLAIQILHRPTVLGQPRPATAVGIRALRMRRVIFPQYGARAGLLIHAEGVWLKEALNK